MTKKYSTKRALVASVLSLLLCFSMLVGTTFAWFTDSVTSAGNIIQTGNLDVEMYWADGTKAVPADDAGWTDASQGAIFNYSKWEPGCVEVRHIKIANKGSLALKYKVQVVANGTVSDLSDVIDVYYVDPAQQVTDRTALSSVPKIGTLTQVLANLGETGNGTLEAGASDTITIAFKMQESAGNEYKNKSIGAEFSIQVLATQLSSEKDSFDDQYDNSAEYPIVPVYPVSTTAELLDKIAKASYGDNIFLNPGEYELDSAISIPSGVSLYGAQAGVPAEDWVNDPDAQKTVITYSGNSGENVLEILQSSENVEKAVSGITINGIMIDCADKAGKGIYVKKSDGEAMEGIKILNCAVVNSTNNGIDVRNTYGAVIENNYVANVVDSAITLGNYNGYHYETWAEVTAYVCNNVIDGVSASQNGAIMIENGMGDVVVSGNTIENVDILEPWPGYSSRDKASAITIYDVYEGGVITVENNVISDADQGIAVYKYTSGTYYAEDWWEGPATDNDGVVIRKNTINEFKTFGIKVTHLNEESTASSTNVTISDNAIVSTTNENALVITDENSNWTVTANGNSLNGTVSDGVNTVVTK